MNFREQYNSLDSQNETRDELKYSEADLHRAVLDKEPVDPGKKDLVQQFRDLDRKFLTGDSVSDLTFRQQKKKLWDMIKKTMSVDDFQ